MNTVRFLNHLRLALFGMAYGLTGVLVAGTLNRVMIADLFISATLVGLFLALPELVSPVRIWFGYRSDGFPILGRRREPYMIIGAAVFGLAVFGATALIVNANGRAGFFALILLMFALYGLGRNLAHNSFQALLADRFEVSVRKRAMPLYEVGTLVGSVIAGGVLGGLLGDYDPQQLVAVAGGTMAVMFVLVLIGTPGQEPRDTVVETATEKAREVPFGTILREMVWADPQVRLFFIIVVLTFIGTLAQDLVLEPYGARVLGMDVGDTARLTAFWGVGVLISMLLSALLLLRWLGQMLLMRIGMVSSMLVFVGVILTGAMGNVGLFNNMVFLMGLGTGLAGAGMLGNIATFATKIRAGVLMGVWGMANLLGRAAGSLISGSLLDIVQRGFGGEAFTAYATVFGLEVLMLAVAFTLTFRLQVSEARAMDEEAGTIAIGGAEAVS